MDDQQLGTHLNEWVNDEQRVVSLNSADLASRVRALQTARAQRRQRTIVTSVVAFAALGFSSLYLKFGGTQDSETAQQVVQHENLNGTAVEPEENLAHSETNLSADFEQMQFHLDLLAMNILVQQQIAKANRLTQECDRLANQEKLASQWLAANLEEIADDNRPK